MRTLIRLALIAVAAVVVILIAVWVVQTGRADGAGDGAPVPVSTVGHDPGGSTIVGDGLTS